MAVATYDITIRAYSSCVVNELDGGVDKRGNHILGPEIGPCIVSMDKKRFRCDGLVTLLGPEDDVDLSLDFEDDDAALAWVEWFDGLHLDPWYVDFVSQGEREVFVA